MTPTKKTCCNSCYSTWDYKCHVPDCKFCHQVAPKEEKLPCCYGLEGMKCTCAPKEKEVCICSESYKDGSSPVVNYNCRSLIHPENKEKEVCDMKCRTNPECPDYKPTTEEIIEEFEERWPVLNTNVQLLGIGDCKRQVIDFLRSALTSLEQRVRKEAYAEGKMDALLYLTPEDAKNQSHNFAAKKEGKVCIHSNDPKECNEPNPYHNH